MTVFKQFPSRTKAIDEERGIFEAVITTESPDRSGDIVRAGGAVLDNFRKNPVVLWAHQYDQPPVAKAISLTVLPGQGIRSQYQFPARGLYPQADIVRNLVGNGFLNGVSIGFTPLVSEDIPGGDVWNPSQDYKSWELLEYSIVPVPANSQALTQAMKALTKSGRALSASNEAKIQEAISLLSDVLKSVDAADQEEGYELNPFELVEYYKLVARSVKGNPQQERKLSALGIELLEYLKKGANGTAKPTPEKYQERFCGWGAVDFGFASEYS